VSRLFEALGPPGRFTYQTQASDHVRLFSGATTLAACLLLACNGGSGGIASSSGGGTGTTGGAAFDAGPCPSDAHRTSDGGCDSDLTWYAGPPLPSKRAFHVTFLVALDGGAYLFVAGGSDFVDGWYVPLTDAWMAPVAPNGTLGGWTQEESFPTNFVADTVAVFNDHVIVTSSTEVLTSRVVAGALTPWRSTTPLPLYRSGRASAVSGDWIYVTGGIDSQDGATDRFTSGDDVLGARIQADGTVNSWQTLTRLPHTRYTHSSFTFAGRLYVVGGGYDTPYMGDDVGLSDVWSAPIELDGTIGSWSQAATLDVKGVLQFHSSLVHEQMLYLVGGTSDYEGGLVVATNEVRRAALATNGTIGPWEEVDPLPLRRSFARQTPLWNGHVYSVGGLQFRPELLLPRIVPDVSIGVFH
jgi:hypothetical protein